MRKCCSFFFCCFERKKHVSKNQSTFGKTKTVEVTKKIPEVTQTCNVIKTDETLLKMIGNYELKELIGKGKYGKVYLGILDGKRYAIKEIERKWTKPTHLEREITIMKLLGSNSHKNIVKYYDDINLETTCNLVLEYCPGEELFDIIVTKNHFSEPESKIIMKQLFLGLSHLHQLGIMHRDLKPENIVFKEGMPLKIIDFGLSRIFDPVKDPPRKLSQVGTAYYMAPEVLTRKYTSSCDEWSLGIILYILLSGQPPFYGDNDLEIIESIKTKNLEFLGDKWSQISNSAIELIKNLLNYKAILRPKAKQCLNHLWFSNNNDINTNFVTIDI